jgi:hypothetical protein
VKKYRKMLMSKEDKKAAGSVFPINFKPAVNKWCAITWHYRCEKTSQQHSAAAVLLMLVIFLHCK